MKLCNIVLADASRQLNCRACKLGAVNYWLQQTGTVPSSLVPLQGGLKGMRTTERTASDVCCTIWLQRQLTARMRTSSGVFECGLH